MTHYIVARIKGTITLTGGRAFFVPAGYKKEKAMRDAESMKIEMSYEELVGAYAPIWDASRMIERLKELAGGDGFADEFFTAMEYKLDSAQAPLKKRIDEIEEENPDHFS